MSKNALEALQRIEKDLKQGNVSSNEELGDKLKDIQLRTCQLIINEMGWTCGNDLLNQDKATLISAIDAMNTMLFYPQWTPMDNSIEAELSDEET